MALQVASVAMSRNPPGRNFIITGCWLRLLEQGPWAEVREPVVQVVVQVLA